MEGFIRRSDRHSLRGNRVNPPSIAAPNVPPPLQQPESPNEPNAAAAPSPPALANPALPAEAPITLRSLEDIADDAAYDVVYAKIPDEHKLLIKRLWYIKRDPYRVQQARFTAWYTQPAHSYEIIQASKSLNGAGEQQRGKTVWCCAHCNNFTSGKNDNTAIKLGHLKRNHRITKEFQVPRGLNDAVGVDENVSVRTKQVVSMPHVYVHQAFQSAVVSFVVICQLSLSLMVNDLFVELLACIYPTISRILPLASDTIRRWVMDAFAKRKQRLIADIGRSQSRVHFSFDLWTSPNHLALMGVVGHYIDHNGGMQTVSLTMVLSFLIGLDRTNTY